MQATVSDPIRGPDMIRSARQLATAVACFALLAIPHVAFAATYPAP